MIFSKFAGIFRNNSKTTSDTVPHRIYGTVMAQARNSALFGELNISDTVMGRYAMLSLHTFLLNHRLKTTQPTHKKECEILSQEVFDLFAIDLERGLRDIGFADTSVHKRKKRLIHSYYALIDEFDHLLGGKNLIKLSQTVADRYYDDIEEPAKTTGALNLANYIIRVVSGLRKQPETALLNGEISWPPVQKEQA